MAEQQVYSVSGINLVIRELVEGSTQLQRIYVRGEISNYRPQHKTGHLYFTVKDESSELACVMYASDARRLRFALENGMKVVIFGRIGVYSARGVYQLYCAAITPEGAGDLSVAFEQLKEKLRREGLFDPAHKKKPPEYPRRIAVVTSATGDAVRDVVKILRARYPLAKVLVLGVLVQGERAPAEIVSALRYANREKIADVIITGRGGGSLEELWAFNDERVARAIYESEIPVISAVGHEADVTIADYVADVRASTPSNAAELAVPNQTELRRKLAELQSRLSVQAEGRVAEGRARLRALAEKRVLTDPMAFVNLKRMQLDYIQKDLGNVAQRQVVSRQRRFEALCAKLDALSPLKVLGRGYAVARTEGGAVLRSAEDVEAGERIEVALARGTLGCRVEEKRMEE